MKTVYDGMISVRAHLAVLSAENRGHGKMRTNFRQICIEMWRRPGLCRLSCCTIQLKCFKGSKLEVCLVKVPTIRSDG